VRVTFRKLREERLTTWDAVRGKRTRVPGASMALGRGDLPHDLVQLVVEGMLGITDGFWGSVASGATFKSTGRKRTRPGRRIIAANREALRTAEQRVGAEVAQWEKGARTPVGTALDDMASRWRNLGDREPLVIEWPSLQVDRP
jgi:hypothetical protein